MSPSDPIAQPAFSSTYGWIMLLAILLSIACWTRLIRRDSRLLFIYIAALIGALFGSKVAYLAAEGFQHFHDSDRWLILATGKSITGALLGGYLGVEISKKLTAYKSPTGDLFAVVVPLGVAVGRVGCILHGCCLGQLCSPGWLSVHDGAGLTRWPAAQVELGFNLIAAAFLAALKKRGILQNQLFHLYLIAYGIFRFFHEIWRDTPRILLGITGYQIIALAVFALGIAGYVRRRRGNDELPLTVMASSAASTGATDT